MVPDGSNVKTRFRQYKTFKTNPFTNISIISSQIVIISKISRVCLIMTTKIDLMGKKRGGGCWKEEEKKKRKKTSTHLKTCMPAQAHTSICTKKGLQ